MHTPQTLFLRLLPLHAAPLLVLGCAGPATARRAPPAPHREQDGTQVRALCRRVHEQASVSCVRQRAQRAQRLQGKHTGERPQHDGARQAALPGCPGLHREAAAVNASSGRGVHETNLHYPHLAFVLSQRIHSTLAHSPGVGGHLRVRQREKRCVSD